MSEYGDVLQDGADPVNQQDGSGYQPLPGDGAAPDAAPDMGPPEGQAAQTGGGKAGKIRPFRKRSVEWLKKEAKNRGFTGYSKMKKDELVGMLKGSKPPRQPK
jgi:hypothetical protein